MVYNRILVLVISIGLMAALVVCGQRHAVELHNRGVDLAMDFDELKALSEREGVAFEEVLRLFRQAGVSSLAIYDTTFDKLSRAGKVIAVYGRDIIQNYHSGALNSIFWRQAVDAGIIDPTRVYLIGRDQRSFSEVKPALVRRFGIERVRSFMVADAEVLEVKAQFGSFMSAPLCLDTAELETAANAGFNILARPANFKDCTAEDVDSVFNRLDGFPVSEIAFAGPQALGYPDALQATAANIQKRGYVLAVIEHPSQLQFYHQDGFSDIASAIGFNRIARLYAFNDQATLSQEQAVRRWETAVAERNIRVCLVRGFGKDLDKDLAYVAAISHSLTVGKAGTFDQYYPHKGLRALVIIGVVAAAVLFISVVSRRLNSMQGFWLRVFAVAAVSAVAALFTGAESLVRLSAALTAAIVFPALAIVWQLDRLIAANFPPLSTTKIITASAGALFMTSVISLCGAAFLSGSLSDVEFFLEFQIFRGIKLTFVMPLVLVTVAFFERFNLVDFRPYVPAFEQIKVILDSKVSVKALLGIFLALAALIILIARSGHSWGMPVAETEIKIRALLEQVFYARPRSKELFLGHPAFILSIAAFLRKYPKNVCYVLTILASIGQSSMVETFAHMRTPIFMSFMRGLDGVLFGGLIGVVLFLAINLFRKENV